MPGLHRGRTWCRTRETRGAKSFAYSLSLTDLYTIWTETCGALGRGLEEEVEALDEIRPRHSLSSLGPRFR